MKRPMGATAEVSSITCKRVGILVDRRESFVNDFIAAHLPVHTPSIPASLATLTAF